MENAVSRRALVLPQGPGITMPQRARTARPLPLHLLAGGILLGMVLFAALCAPLLAPLPPDVMRPALRLLPPGPGHIFGTDPFGRDLFSQVVYGARLALQMSILSVLLSALPGISMGLLAGYYKGWLEQVVSRVMDGWLSFPSMLLAIVLVARLGPSLLTVTIAIGSVGIPAYYRLVRNGTLSIRSSAYVEAARAIGASDGRILLRHILPNLSSPVIVLTTLRLGAMLLAGGGLSFIGLGAQPPQPEWGALLATGRQYMDLAWWLAVFPGLAIAVSVAGFNLFGDGLRDLLAPNTSG